MKVLLVAHTCRPVGASEPGSAWNWALHLSQYHEVGMLCHPQYRAEADAALPQTGHAFRICYVALPRPIDPWNPERGERGLRLHYMLWQHAALRRARELHREYRFDLVHQVGLGSVGAPSPFWRLGIPAVWGPLGGGQTAPAAFRRYFGAHWRNEVMRTWRVRSLPYWPPLRRTVSHSAVVMATNYETMDVLRRAGARNPILFADSGPDCDSLRRPVLPRPDRSETLLIWAGRLEAHKALPIGLEALAKVDARVRLQVAGGGPLRAEWEALSRSLGLESKVEFLGKMEVEDLLRRFRQADGFLFTSLRDSTGSVVWQAMAEGLPAITLDHQGAGALIPASAALKVKVSSPEITVPALTRAIEDFARMGPARAAMGNAARLAATRNSWPERAARMSEQYERIACAAPSRQTSASRRAASPAGVRNL